MEYCKHCGAEVKEGAVFCAQCGKGLYEKEVKSKAQVEKLNQSVKRITNFLKKRKWVIGLTIVVLSFIVFYQIGLSMTSQKQLVDQFEKAINEEDAKALSTLLYSPDSELEVNEKTAENLLNLFIKNPDRFDETLWGLSSQANIDKKETNLRTAWLEFSSSLSPLEISNIGKTKLIFDEYKIEVTPQYMSIDTNLKDVKIFVDDELVETVIDENSTIRLGPYLPGTYQVKAVYEGENASSELVEESELFSNAGEDYIYFDFNIDFLHINSNEDDAKILINGRDTGLTVDESDSLGMVALDGSLKLQLEKDYPWGRVKSEEIQINNRDVRLNIDPIDEEFKEMIMEIINQYYINTFTAIKTKDTTKLQGMTEQERESLVSVIEDLEQNNKMLVTDNKLSTMYDLQSFRFSNKDGKYFVTLDAGYSLNGNYVLEDSTEEHRQKALQDNLVYYFTYELVFDEQEDKWLINKSNEEWFALYLEEKQFELSIE